MAAIRKSNAKSSLPAPRVDSKIEVPALAKALDIIELLSLSSDGLTLNEIVADLDRTIGEIYRIVVFLSRRGYLSHDAELGRYALTPKLLEIANRHPPTDRMIRLALPLMSQLSATTGQSCHFAVLHHENVIVIASAPSPKPASYSVKTGAVFPLGATSSGLVILAHLPGDLQASVLEHKAERERASMAKRMETIRAKGQEKMKSTLVEGVLNLSVPVFDRNGVVGAITIGYMRQYGISMHDDDVMTALKQTCQELSRQLGWVAN